MMKYIIDLDGTILDGREENLDSVHFLKKLQSNNIDFLIMTNSIKSPYVVMKRLADIGVDIAYEQVMNPISTINTYIKDKGYERVYVVGSAEEIEQVHATPCKDFPELIVLLDFKKENVDYETLQEILNHIENEVPIVTASGSPYYMDNGKKNIDTGAFVKLFESIVSTTIEVFGKPSERYFKAGVKALNTVASEVTVIGDDYKTDIYGGNKIGSKTILICSGKYRLGDEMIEKPTSCITSFTDIKVQ